MTTRALTPGEIALARTMFRDAIDYDRVRVHRAKWAWFQPRDVIMAPDGDIWVHPAGPNCHADWGGCAIDDKGWFLHELTHVWQAQRRGRWYLAAMRHPFCRYDYTLRPGWDLTRYGLEQQAEIVRHAFLLREGRTVPGATWDQYRGVLPF